MIDLHVRTTKEWKSTSLFCKILRNYLLLLVGPGLLHTNYLFLFFARYSRSLLSQYSIASSGNSPNTSIAYKPGSKCPILCHLATHDPFASSKAMVPSKYAVVHWFHRTMRTKTKHCEILLSLATYSTMCGRININGKYGVLTSITRSVLLCMPKKSQFSHPPSTNWWIDNTTEKKRDRQNC